MTPIVVGIVDLLRNNTVMARLSLTSMNTYTAGSLAVSNGLVNPPLVLPPGQYAVTASGYTAMFPFYNATLSPVGATTGTNAVGTNMGGCSASWSRTSVSFGVSKQQEQ